MRKLIIYLFFLCSLFSLFSCMDEEYKKERIRQTKNVIYNSDKYTIIGLNDSIIIIYDEYRKTKEDAIKVINLKKQ